MRAISLFFAAATAAPALLAHSGPMNPYGQITLQKESLAGMAAWGLSVFLCTVGASLRLKRKGGRWVLALPLLALVFHPVHPVLAIQPMAHGMPFYAGMFGIAIWAGYCIVELNLYRMTATDFRHKRPSTLIIMYIYLVVALAGTILAVVKYVSPQQPFPQESYIQYPLYFSPFVRHQETRTKSNRPYRSSGAEILREQNGEDYFNTILAFEQYLGNNDPAQPEHRKHAHIARMLQGTQADPDAWHVAGGLSDWAIIARPVGFPDDMPQVQYLLTSDGKIWSKPDPKTGKFLLKGKPKDPAKQGWQDITDQTNWRR